jgi:stearoyl-CoA desaturase (delta-9 desaturase)
LRAGAGADATGERVVWDPVHSIWDGGMHSASLMLGPLTFTPAAFLIFLLTPGAGFQRPA